MGLCLDKVLTGSTDTRVVFSLRHAIVLSASHYLAWLKQKTDVGLSEKLRIQLL